MLGPDDRRLDQQAARTQPPPFTAVSPWSYPVERYYYPWFDETLQTEHEPSDREIKSAVVERLKENPRTRDDKIKVDVKQRVVILGGEVSSWLAKRAAGDDAWDTPGVVDVSNQLRPPELSRT